MKTRRCILCMFSAKATWPFAYCLLRNRHVLRCSWRRCPYACNKRRGGTL